MGILADETRKATKEARIATGNLRDPKTGKVLPKVPHEQRPAIIADALNRLENGEPMTEIAAEYGVSAQAIMAWIVVDAPDSAGLARARFLGKKLGEHVMGIEEAPDPFSLTRSKEAFKAWSWIAERRLPAMFGANQVAQEANITIVINKLGDNDEVTIDATSPQGRVTRLIESE